MSKPRRTEKRTAMILKTESEILRKLRNELRKRINKGGALKASRGPGPGDSSSFDADNVLSILFAGRLAAALKDIERALQKVEEGTYGYCEECGEKIAPERLRLIPFALYCVSCLSIMEKNRTRDEEESDLGLYSDSEEIF